MAKYISRAVIAAAALALGVSGGNAVQYGTGNLVVSVNAVPTCDITSVAPIVFSEIAKGAATTEEIKPSVIAVSCNSGGWKLSIGDTEEVRTMKIGTAASLNYKLCKPSPSSYTDCAPFNLNNPVIGEDLTSSVTIYGVMQGNIHPTKSGNYIDTVTIQLTN